MYVIYYNGKAIASTGHPKFPIISGTLEQAKNTADVFTFTLPNTNPERDTPQIRSGIITLKKDGVLLFKGDVLSTSIKFDNSREIVCQGCLAWLNDISTNTISMADTVLNRFNATVDRYNELCKSTRQIVKGQCLNKPAATLKIYTTEEYMTLFEYFRQTIEKKGGMMLIRYSGEDAVLDYLVSKGKTSKQTIYFGQNLLDLENYVSAETTASVIYPKGKDGITISSVNDGKVYLRNEPLYAKYGNISVPMKFDSETPQELKDDAQASLNALAVLNQTITLTALDLNLIDATIDSIDIGDMVRAVSAPHGLDTTLECTEKVTDILDPANCKVTLGKTLKSLSKIIAIGGIR